MALMPTWVTGVMVVERRLISSQGFTLLELLVVMVIVAITSSLILFQGGAGSEQKRFVDYAESVAAYTRHLCSQAVFTSRPRGIMFAGAVKALQWQDGHWQEAADQAGFPLMPEQMNMSILRDGFPVHDASELDALEPHLLCESNGILTPYQLELGYEDQAASYLSMTVDANAQHEIHIKY